MTWPLKSHLNEAENVLSLCFVVLTLQSTQTYFVLCVDVYHSE